MLFNSMMLKIKKKDGFGTIEAVILIAIVLGLAIIFRKYIIDFVEKVFESIFEDANEFLN